MKKEIKMAATYAVCSCSAYSPPDKKEMEVKAMTTHDVERILEGSGYTSEQDDHAIIMRKTYKPTEGKSYTIKSDAMTVIAYIRHRNNAAHLVFYRDHDDFKRKTYTMPGTIINAIKTTLDYNGYTF